MERKAFIYVASCKIRKTHGLFGDCLQLNFIICTWKCIPLDENSEVFSCSCIIVKGKTRTSFQSTS